MERYEGSPAVVIERRKGTPDSPFSNMDESLVVTGDGKVLLSEIPNELNRVIVTSDDNTTWYEITEGKIPENGFKVDYINKLVTFNVANVGKQLNFKYFGEGNHYYSLHSIYTKLEGGSVVETLGELIENGTDALDALDKLDQKLNEVTQATINAITATNDTRDVIIEGNQVIDTANNKIVDIDSKINEATTKLSELDLELDEARNAISDVQQKSTVVEGIITDGQGVINNAQLIINEVKSVGNFNLTTFYKKNNTVLDKGSSWIALQDTQNNPLPILPITENTYWRLSALHGTKGDKGDTGAALSILGKLNDESQLPPTGEAGQAYTVNGELYVWSENLDSWENVGNVKGEKGDTGKDGLSAYEVAVNNGFVGTLEEWLSSLKGEKGDKGQDADLTEVNQEIADLQQTVTDNQQVVTEHLNESGYYKGNNFTIVNPYKNKGSLSLKGQLHCHTTNSDGTKSASAVVTEYKNVGYDFVAITDHDFLTPDPQIEGIVFIPGVEELAWGNHAHIAAYNVTEQQGDAIYPSHEAYRPSYKEVIDFHRRRGGITSIAHPNLGTLGMPVDEIIRNEGFHFVEIFNGLAGYARKTIDTALSAGKHFFILATDDYHGSTPFNQGYVVVHASQRNKESILASLKQGGFYASTGNDINIEVDNKVVAASSTTLSTFRFIGYNGKVFKEITNALEASYEIVGDERYIRVESIRQSDEKVAFSQPIWIEQLNIEVTKPRERNMLVNSNFDVWQRGASFSKDSMSQVSPYTADRWWLSSNAEAYTVTRYESGDWLGKYFARLVLTTKGASFSDIALLQSPENQLVKKMKGRTITFSVEIRKNTAFNSGKMRISIATGTVADERNAATGRKTKELLIEHSELDTQEWRRFSITTSVEFDVESMMCAIRLADTFGQTSQPPDGSYIDIRRTQLVINPDVVEYEIPTFNEELQDCLRFYEKSYDYNVPPKTNNVSGGIEVKVLPGNTINANQSYGKVNFKVTKRKLPIVTVIPFTDVSKSQIVSSDDGVDLITNSGVPNYIGTNGFNVYNTSGQTLTTSRNAVIFHWEADAEM